MTKHTSWEGKVEKFIDRFNLTKVQTGHTIVEAERSALLFGLRQTICTLLSTQKKQIRQETVEEIANLKADIAYAIGHAQGSRFFCENFKAPETETICRI